jgi:hypothetical protein
VQFGSLFVEVGSQLSLVSANPFKLDWAQAVAPLSFLLSLVFVMLLGYWFFRRWDLLDQVCAVILALTPLLYYCALNPRLYNLNTH